MATLKEINLRITSLKNTKKITEAMKLIAITKLNRAQNNVKKASVYYNYLEKIFSMVKDVDSFKEHPLIQEKTSTKKVKVIIFTSDKGLCGPFNSNIIKKADNFIQGKKDIEIKTDHFGKKGFEFFKNQKRVENWYEKIFREDFNFIKASHFMKKNIDSFSHNKLDELYIIYGEFKSILKQIPVVARLLPLQLDKEEKVKQNTLTSNQLIPNFLFEPNQNIVIDSVIKKIIYFKLYFAYLNTIAGENSARMTAMDNATNNCNDMINKFTLERNQLRQANITKELIEIISGAESI